MSSFDKSNIDAIVGKSKAPPKSCLLANTNSVAPASFCNVKHYSHEGKGHLKSELLKRCTTSCIKISRS